MTDNEIIQNAQRLVGGQQVITADVPFHQTSFIYKTSNEDFSLYDYLYNGKQKILTVEGSGDQILNALAKGIIDITAFDISVYPRYFTDLKLSTLLTRPKNEFEQFFYQLSTYDKDFDSDTFDNIVEAMQQHSFSGWNPEKSLIFWNSLFCFFEGFDIYNSRLFSSEPYSLTTIKERNLFLDSNTYKQIKKRIAELKLTHKVGNIIEIAKDNSEQYDIINLSNIISYSLDGTGTASLQKYLNLLRTLPLADDGIAITYLFNLSSKLEDCIRRDFYDVNYDLVTKDKSKDAVLVYKKKV